MTQREQYLQTVRDLMTDIGNLHARAQGVLQCYVDRGYDSGATNAITDAELAPYGVIQYDLGGAYATLQALRDLMSGVTVQGNALYHATVSKWRQL